MTSDTLAARGHWVTRGGIKRFIPSPEVKEVRRCCVCGDPISRASTRCSPCEKARRVDSTRNITCVDCDRRIKPPAARCKECDADWPVRSIVGRLADGFDRIPAAAEPATGPLCDCGCLLATPTEYCPSCRVWAREAEQKANLRHVYKSADLVSEFEWLTKLGTSAELALKQLGVTKGAIEKARKRMNEREAA